MKLVLATRNAHKLEEIRAILADLPVQLLTLDDLDDMPDELPEDGDTFEHNALQKARYVYDRTGLLTCADDSGIEVDALDGRPGVHSKRFSPQATGPANNRKLLAMLDGRTDRSARFRCVLALVGDGVQHTVDGRCEGRIALTGTGEGGFGYDPIFLPDEAPGRSMAQLNMAQKNAISHRGRSFSQLPDILPGGRS
jgi:XTP/dITP diphosphohydrolase